MRAEWNMASGEFDSCWCADDGCCEGASFAGWNPAIVDMQEQVAMQVASDMVARYRQPVPLVLDGEVEAFLQRMYVFQQ